MIEVPFEIGAHVKIIPLENAPGRVVELFLNEDGWAVVVRYFHGGEARTVKCFMDEVRADYLAELDPAVLARIEKTDAERRRSAAEWETSARTLQSCEGVTHSGRPCGCQHGRSVNGRILCPAHKDQGYEGAT